MNFGAFGGGFAQGLDSGMRMGKTVRDLIKERKLEDLREQGMEEARNARAVAVNGMVTTEAPAPPSAATPAPPAPGTTPPAVQAAPAVAAAPSPTDSPDAASAATAASAMAPAAKAFTPRWEGDTGPGPNDAEIEARMKAKGQGAPVAATPDTTASIAQPTPQTAAAAGVPSRAAAAKTHDGYPARQNADGSYSTEVSITVTDPRINGGKPTNIPSLWGGKEVDEGTAVKNAIAAGKQYQAFGSIDEAVSVAKSRSEAGGAGAPPPVVKPVKVEGKFFVGGKGYATKDEAMKAADAATPSTMDFFMKNTVPKLQEAYVAAGDPAKAEAWGNWAASKQNQQSMAEWSKMYRAAQMGDMEKAADHAFNLYKKMDDGITPVSKETVKDKDGNVTGFNVRLKNESSGEVTSQFIDKRGLIEMGLSGLAPDKLFEMTFKRQAEADKAGMEARIKRGERVAQVQDNLVVKKYEADRTDAREIRKAERADSLETKKGEQKVLEITLTKQLDAENMGVRERAQAESKIAMLKENGYSEDQIKAMIPAIVGAGEHKKTTDPAERRALIASDLVKNDPTFSRLPVTERNKKVDEMMTVIYGDTPAKPAAPGAAPTAAAPGKPVYVKDTKTGEIFERRDGKLFPVKQPPATPAPGQRAPAGGMPDW